MVRHVKSFKEMIETLRRKYREEFLDSIAYRLYEEVERVIEREVMKKIDEKFAEKVGVEPLPSIIEEVFYSHRDVYDEVVKEVHREVFKLGWENG